MVARLERCRLWVSPLVLGECSISCAAKVVDLQNRGALGRVDDDLISSDVYLDLLTRHSLGAGETECIAVAQELGYFVCSDDRQARELSIELFGRGRTIGTARLLQWCVGDNILVCREAEQRFQGMRDAGGFLPVLERGFFCAKGD